MTGPSDAIERRRAVVVAGHTGDVSVPRSHLGDADADVRAAALGALERIGVLDDRVVADAFTDPSPIVRRRAVELAATRPEIALHGPLDDADPTVVEVAAWACGEHEHVDDDELRRLIELATDADEPLVREAAAAALGAIGDERGLPAILAACTDKPHVRRRAVLALAPFDGDEVEAAIDRALGDRDWQVRQSAEDLRRAAGEHPI
jgi:HEAT repeat protein